jgi:hypothetical protein
MPKATLILPDGDSAQGSEMLYFAIVSRAPDCGNGPPNANAWL